MFYIKSLRQGLSIFDLIQFPVINLMLKVFILSLRVPLKIP